MRTALTKHQLAWLLIRVLGLFLLYFTVREAAMVFLVLSKLGDLNATPGSPLGSAGDLLRLPVIQLFLYGIGALYCLAAGASLHRILMSESPSYGSRSGESPEEETDPATGLTIPEKSRFQGWLNDHPEIIARALEDQVAMFRDAQKRGEFDD